MFHYQVTPSVGGVAAPAFFDIRGIITINDHFMAFYYRIPEIFCMVRRRGGVTAATIPVIGRWMSVPLDFPSFNTMACPAVFTEFSVMRIIMAVGAGKIRVEKGMIHFGYIRAVSPVLRVAIHAVLVRFMKPEPRFKRLRCGKKMALYARLVIHTPPGDMAGFTIGDKVMGAAQRAGLCGFVMRVQPYRRCDNQSDNDSIEDDFLHGSQRSP